MKKIKSLLKSNLFENFSEQELIELLSRCDYRIKSFVKNEEIFSPTDEYTKTAIILSGIIDIIQISPLGKEELVVRDFAGEMTGQAFNITSQKNELTHFRAFTDSEILFLDINQIIDYPCMKSYYTKFIHNITRILATKNIMLTKKIQLLTQKTLRDKLMTFFNQCAVNANSSTFTVDFSREQLAQFICSERSSVSRELGYMQDDGLISIDGKQFTIL